MTFDVKIHLTDKKHRYLVGEHVNGYADVLVPELIPLSSISISLHCIGEVKWIEDPGKFCIQESGQEYFNQYDYLEQDYPLDNLGFTSILKNQETRIPFEFHIPKDWNLPSSMISTHGFIRYSIRVTVKLAEEIKNWNKDIVVQSPMDDQKLLVSVGGNAEKLDIIHTGKITMNAGIGRKGFAPGERIPVLVSVHNGSSARVTPRISLRQVQIFMCGARHKTIETTVNHEAIVGSEIAPHSDAEEELGITIPSDDSLSIKSSIITVKYFVHVTLDVPHSLDLHINLPIVITSPCVIEELVGQKKVD